VVGWEGGGKGGTVSGELYKVGVMYSGGVCFGIEIGWDGCRLYNDTLL
jgi:hypothetical protein